MTAPFAHQRAPALLLTLLLHLGLFALWQLARQPKPEAPRGPTHWLTLISPWRPPALPPKPGPVPAKHPPPLPQQQRPSTATPAAAAATGAATVPAPQPAAEREVLPVVAPLEQQGRSAADIMKQARRDLGKIDRDLRDADAKWVRAPVSSPHSRMQAAFDAARDAVPPKWYEAARIVPIGDQSGNGPRVYKIVTAAGTYCVTYDTNHSLKEMLPKDSSSKDQMSAGIKPTYSTCPK